MTEDRVDAGGSLVSVLQCVEVRFVQGKQLSFEGSFVEANAAKERFFTGAVRANRSSMPAC
jgi:hypothetical protein